MRVDESTLVATNSVREAIILILDATVTKYGPDHPALEGVETALGAIFHENEIPASEAIRLAYRRVRIMDVDRRRMALESALSAFWERFANSYPEIANGDTDPVSHELWHAAYDETGAWLERNY